MPPAAVISSPVFSIVSGRSISDRPAVRLLRPVAYTQAPARASSTAMARPAPRVAPATSATFPSSTPARASSVAMAPDHSPLFVPAPGKPGEDPAPRARPVTACQAAYVRIANSSGGQELRWYWAQG